MYKLIFKFNPGGAYSCDAGKYDADHYLVHEADSMVANEGWFYSLDEANQAKPKKSKPSAKAVKE